MVCAARHGGAPPRAERADGGGGRRRAGAGRARWLARLAGVLPRAGAVPPAAGAAPARAPRAPRPRPLRPARGPRAARAHAGPHADHEVSRYLLCSTSQFTSVGSLDHKNQIIIEHFFLGPSLVTLRVKDKKLLKH